VERIENLLFANGSTVMQSICHRKLEACIDDERRFKTAKRLQAPGEWWRHCSETVFPR